MSTTTKESTYTSAGTNITFVPDETFDNQRMRHYLDGELVVMHCHHYSSLFTQLASDAAGFNGPTLLTEASAESMWPMLKSYYQKHSITEIPERIAIAEQFFSFIGLGDVEFTFGENSGWATMKHSHVDEGWLKKWGQNEKPINFIGRGYLQAAWAAIFDKNNPSALNVEEVQGIVCGASTSRFNFSW